MYLDEIEFGTNYTYSRNENSNENNKIENS